MLLSRTQPENCLINLSAKTSSARTQRLKREKETEELFKGSVWSFERSKSETEGVVILYGYMVFQEWHTI